MADPKMNFPFRLKALSVALLLFLISSIFGWALLHNTPPDSWTPTRVFCSFLAGTTGVLCLGLGSVYLFLSTRLVSEHLTLISALKQAILTYINVYFGRRELRRLRRCSLDPRRAQEDLLREIISRNKDTEYGLRFKLREITCLRDLRSEHPLTEYTHYESYVRKVAKGRGNVMTADRVSRLVVTSGTTGEGKLIPQDMFKIVSAMALLRAIIIEAFPKIQPMQKGFRIHCNSKISKSECGITISSLNVVEESMKPILISNPTPPDGFLIESVKEAFYVHFLFALRERNLGYAMGIFASIFVDAFKYFEDHWPQMVDDIANGTLNDDLELPTSIRESLTRALGTGDPSRAEEVRRECEKGQQGIMKRLWPNMFFVAAIDNLGIRERLMETFAEGLTVYSLGYGASEGSFGYNLDPLQSGKEEYVLSIADCIFEFIPREDSGKPNPRTFFIDEVELGEAYELVISQTNGLYRYRVGDVVEVSGFYNNAPKVKFLYRTGSMLNLFGEKVDQITVSDSLESVLCHYAEIATLRYYCVAESTLMSGLLGGEDGGSTAAAHYVFFLEMTVPTDKRGDHQRDLDLEELAKRIDDNIYSRHKFYRTFKDTHQIGACRVHLVKPGSFDKLKSFIFVNTTASAMQFKMPKKLRTREMAKVLCDNIQQTALIRN